MIKKEDLNYPVLLGEQINKRQLQVWCPYCAEYHLHGLEEGHKVAHCRNVNSPFIRTGYIVTMNKGKPYKKYPDTPEYIRFKVGSFMFIEKML